MDIFQYGLRLRQELEERVYGIVEGLGLAIGIDVHEAARDELADGASGGGVRVGGGDDLEQRGDEVLLGVLEVLLRGSVSVCSGGEEEGARTGAALGRAFSLALSHSKT